MVTLTVFLDIAFPDCDFGSNNLITFGLVSVEAMRKNSSRKNIISFIAEVCTSAETPFWLFLKFICLVPLTGQYIRWNRSTASGSLFQPSYSEYGNLHKQQYPRTARLPKLSF